MRKKLGSPEKVDEAISHLSEPNEDLSQTCSSVIKWLARDHGEMFIPHVKTIVQYLDSPHAGVQTNIAIAIGNIAQFDPDHRPAYAKALTPAAEDLDSEVRKAAAIALGAIHCPESVKMLKYLINNDTSSDVIEEGKNSLNKIQANTAQ